jgi:extradiol dioxygenase family protein
VTAPILHLTIPVRDLAEARGFYADAFGCRVGRTRGHWLDIWFFGMQLTLQERPDEVIAAADQGVRHFGVVLQDAPTYDALVDRLRAHDVQWLHEPERHSDAELSGKRGGKLADPSGNVIEVKYYDDASDYLAGPE